MARTKQKLINYNTQTSAMPLTNDVEHGEIVVRYKTDQPELLIKIDSGSGETFATFKDSVAVSGMIVSAITGATGDISDLQTKLGALSSSTDTFIHTTVPDTYLTKADAASVYQGQSAMTNYYTKTETDNTFLSQSAASKTYATSANVVSAIDGVAGDLADLTTRVATNEGAISNLTTGLSATVVSDYATKTYADNKAKDAKDSAISSAKSYVDTVIADYATSANVVSAITVEKERAEGIESDHETRISNLKDIMDTITEENGLSATVIANKTKLDTLESTYETKEDANIKYTSAVTYVDTVSGNIETHLNETYWTSATTQDKLNTITTTISTVSGAVVSTSAAVKTLSGDVVTYVDNKVSSVYRYKGSKDTVSQLPTSNNVIGDVWNVVSGSGTIGTASYVPPGTNYAWTGSEWDALGGTIDLSTYATKSYVDGKTSGITNMVTDISNLQTNLGTLSGSVSGFSGQVINNYYTKTNTDNIFLSKSGAQNTYLTMASASSTYMPTTAIQQTYWTSATTKGKLDTIDSTIQGLSGATVAIESAATESVKDLQMGTVSSANASHTQSGAKTAVSNRVATIDLSELVIDCGNF